MNNCAYCKKGAFTEKFAYPVCEMASGVLYIFKEQSKLGRVILAHHQHVSEIIDLSEEDRNRFISDVVKVSKTIHKVFHPDKVNYGAYGDEGGHLHFHIVPKYRGGDEWGSTFEMNSGKVILTDDEYEKMANTLRIELEVLENENAQS